MLEYDHVTPVHGIVDFEKMEHHGDPPGEGSVGMDEDVVNGVSGGGTPVEGRGT